MGWVAFAINPDPGGKRGNEINLIVEFDKNFSIGTSKKEKAGDHPGLFFI